MSTWVYIIKRILGAIPILFIVSLISFFLIRLSPVDPLAQLKLNPAISKETIEKETKRLGLDKPVIVQYALWAKNFIKGDMGYCTDNTKVSVKIKSRILNTLLLSFCVIFFSWIIAIPLGILGAVSYNSTFDKLLTLFSSVGMAIPSFFFAVIMLLFAQKTGLFPVGGLTSINFQEMNLFSKIIDILWHITLPVFVLTTISLSSLTRQMRANLLDVLNSEYVKFAYAKGLTKTKVIIKHALRNAINPIITLLGFEFAGLLSGAALTEYVFQYPGLGKLILEAVMQSDINLVMASLMIGAIMLICGNLLADILLKITDPRVRV
ncbi:MAG: ABC transporter permease [Candidatus Gastranaerophilales bacterium]|nr:ABC transporter permease [bacterium]MBR2068809.1 ABC transporter permease [Candidatus Gastranaerophilales bacterium]